MSNPCPPVRCEDAGHLRHAASRTVRIGLLGFGTVGRAVAAELESRVNRFRQLDVSIVPVAALVRNARRARPRAAGWSMCEHLDSVLSRNPDVVIEVLGGVEPADRHVERCLRAGIPVITANKALVAERGPALTQTARDAGVQFRYEASVMAGVPLLSLLAQRAIFADTARVEAILNGTANYVATRCAEGHPIQDVLQEAVRIGFAEPDSYRDLAGLDAADKLTILLRELGEELHPAQIRIDGIESLTLDDYRTARRFGGELKSVAVAHRTSTGIGAAVGPTFVPTGHALGNVRNEVNGLVIRGDGFGPLFYAGPGAGPKVTAGTIVDDLIEVVAQDSALQPSINGRNPTVTQDAQATGPEHHNSEVPFDRWLIRADRTLRPVADIRSTFSCQRIQIEQLQEANESSCGWAALVSATGREQIRAAAAGWELPMRMPG